MNLLPKQVELYYKSVNRSNNCKKYLEYVTDHADLSNQISFERIKFFIENINYDRFVGLISLDIRNEVLMEIFKIFSIDMYLSICPSQIESKRMLKKCNDLQLGHVISVASWFGQHYWLLDKFSSFTFNEIDEKCLPFLEVYKNKIIFDDMMNIDYSKYNTIINTSCEHIKLDKWMNLIPSNKIMILQSTNMVNEDHTNIHHSMLNFIENIKLSKILHTNQIEIVNGYKRFFIIGIK